MRWAALSLILPILCVLPSAGQQKPYSLSVDVDLVVLNVRVIDKDSRSVPNLSKEAFQIEEDGKPQNVALFDGEDAPATIGLVLDSSASINSRHSQILNAAMQFTGSSNPRDEMFVLQFNERLYWMVPKELQDASNIDWLYQALTWTPVGGRTALYDAVAAALERAGRGVWEKRALIVLSDGGDNASRKTFSDVVRLAQESNVTIYTIGLFDPLASEARPPVLRKLAELTGGDAYMPEGADSLLPVWEKISQGIRSQYTIGFRPAPSSVDGKFHSIRVRVKVPGLRGVSAHTRPGYRARLPVVEP